jgi:hypothetical protein
MDQEANGPRSINGSNSESDKRGGGKGGGGRKKAPPATNENVFWIWGDAYGDGSLEHLIGGSRS